MKTVIYSKYSNERNPKLAIRTDILADEAGKRYVQKIPVFPEGEAHVAKLSQWYKVFSKMCEGSRLSYNHCEELPEGVEFEYLTGETLEEALLQIKKEKGLKSCAQEFLKYLELIRKLHTGAVFEMTDGFREVFGEVELPEGMIASPCSNIDLVCGNILVNGEQWTAIDYEWSFDFPIPVKYLLYRIIFYFTDHAGRGKEFGDYAFLQEMGITREEQTAFEKMETHFQQYVCREHVPLRDLYEDISDGSYKIEEAMNKEILQVFFDYGEGVSEETSITFSMENWGIRKEITLPDGVKALRIDPGSAAGVAELRELCFESQEKRVPFTLREGAIIGNWLYFGDNDPNILINDIPVNAKMLMIDMKVYPVADVPMEKISRLAKDFVKQKQLMREMENTKVWKLYRKYREHRERK